MTQDDIPPRPEQEPDEVLQAETSVEEATGVRGPFNWWQVGLVGLGILIAILLVMQMMGGGASTDVVPGTPVVQSEPQTQ